MHLTDHVSFSRLREHTMWSFGSCEISTTLPMMPTTTLREVDCWARHDEKYLKGKMAEDHFEKDQNGFVVFVCFCNWQMNIKFLISKS